MNQEYNTFQATYDRMSEDVNKTKDPLLDQKKRDLDNRELVCANERTKLNKLLENFQKQEDGILAFNCYFFRFNSAKTSSR